MTNKINDNVAMMILENAERVSTLNTNAYLEISFEKTLHIEGSKRLCNICVLYWKPIESYSITIRTDTDIDMGWFISFRTATEMVDFLGKIFSDEVIVLMK